MKPARLVVLAIALAAAAVAAFMASRSHRAAPQKAAAPPVATVEVLIAKTDLARGETVKPRDVGWQVWPKTAANKRFIRKTARPNAARHFVGAIVRVPVAAGQPIYDPMVVFAKSSGFMAAILPKGMRAVALQVSADSDAGGFILPQDHVDVVLTRQEKPAGKANGTTRLVASTILRNVRVLAVDQKVEEKNGQKYVLGRTVTLEVTPPQATALALARQQGTLSLALRSIADSQSPIPLGAAAPSAGRNHDRKPINMVRYGVSTLASRVR